MLTGCIYDALLRGTSPHSLKFINITPVHGKATDKENYRPVSVLSLFSKIFGKVIYDQLSQHLEKYRNSLLCGFRQVHSSQNTIFKLFQAW